MSLTERLLTISPRGHLLSPARYVPSPNADARPPGTEIDLIVIHSISVPPGEYGGSGIEQLFTNRLDADEHEYYREIADLKVSAHVLIRRDGALVQFVPFDRRAWHAGRSAYRGRRNCNDFSVGIELEGLEIAPFERAQYASLTRVVTALLVAYPGLSAERIVGHCDVAPGRKTDPGPYFERDFLTKYR